MTKTKLLTKCDNNGCEKKWCVMLAEKVCSKSKNKCCIIFTVHL
jgi:hypothetical protein